MLKRSSIACVSFLISAALSAQQMSRPAHRHTQEAVQSSPASALLDRAEPMLAQGDFAAAEPVLQQATEADPKSYQAWYDLGFAERGLKKQQEAVSAFQHSVELNDKVFESALELGLALAGVGDRDNALKYLQRATTLQPSADPERGKERAWIASGKLQSGSDAAAAEHAFTEASKLVSDDPEPHLELARLYQSSGKLDRAQTEYRSALEHAEGPARAEILLELVNITVESKDYAGVESALRQYIAANPQDGRAHLLLGRVLAGEGKFDDALKELASGGAENDSASVRERAQLLASLHRDSEAAALYEKLIQTNPQSAELHHEYGLALQHAKQFPAAEQQLLQTVKLNPNMPQVYGDLAVAASENGHYELTLKALEYRTKLLGDNPGTYFLRATALDHLRRYPEATQNYRQFLAVANGKYPDEEWKARHRLIAIEKLK